MARKRSVDRRKFLKGAAVTGAAALVPDSVGAGAPQAPGRAPPAQALRVPRPRPLRGERRTPWVEIPGGNHRRCGRRLHGRRVQVARLRVRRLEPRLELPRNPRVDRQLRRQQAPEFITCCHEESSVAMAHGYFKIEGKPMAVLCHGTVGLQHAAMAIYNAYCDRVPVYIVAGNTLDATVRRPGVEWVHSVQDAAAMVREFIKWDDMPVSLPHFAESAVRAYKIAMTPPMMPVLIVVDSGCRRSRSARTPGLPCRS